MCESVHGAWHYHLYDPLRGYATTALCGARTMYCDSPLDSWGFKPEHYPSTYCSECESIAASKVK